MAATRIDEELVAKPIRGEFGRLEGGEKTLPTLPRRHTKGFFFLGKGLPLGAKMPGGLFVLPGQAAVRRGELLIYRIRIFNFFVNQHARHAAGDGITNGQRRTFRSLICRKVSGTFPANPIFPGNRR